MFCYCYRVCIWLVLVYRRCFGFDVIVLVGVFTIIICFLINLFCFRYVEVVGC